MTSPRPVMLPSDPQGQVTSAGKPSWISSKSRLLARPWAAGLSLGCGVIARWRHGPRSLPQDEDGCRQAVRSLGQLVAGKAKPPGISLYGHQSLWS